MINKFDGKYRFLSNFFPAKVRDKFGIEYPSTENAYQAMKTTDIKIRKLFVDYTAGQSKKNGRRLEIREDWENIKVGIMEDLLRQKFNQEPLKTKLLETGDEELIEGNYWGDTFWGVCNGAGKNILGKLLMKIRGELKDAQ